MNVRVMVVWALALAAFLSALGVVVAKHESRKLFVTLQELEAERDRLNLEWNRLQLEESVWATHARVETLAEDRLSMGVPGSSHIGVVE